MMIGLLAILKAGGATSRWPPHPDASGSARILAELPAHGRSC